MCNCKKRTQFINRRYAHTYTYTHTHIQSTLMQICLVINAVNDVGRDLYMNEGLMKQNEESMVKIQNDIGKIHG